MTPSVSSCVSALALLLRLNSRNVPVLSYSFFLPIPWGYFLFIPLTSSHLSPLQEMPRPPRRRLRLFVGRSPPPLRAAGSSTPRGLPHPSRRGVATPTETRRRHARRHGRTSRGATRKRET